MHNVDTNKVPGEISHDRRRFLGTAGAAAPAVGAAQLGMTGSAKAQTTGAGSAGLAAAAPRDELRESFDLGVHGTEARRGAGAVPPAPTAGPVDSGHEEGP